MKKLKKSLLALGTTLGILIFCVNGETVNGLDIEKDEKLFRIDVSKNIMPRIPNNCNKCRKIFELGK